MEQSVNSRSTLSQWANFIAHFNKISRTLVALLLQSHALPTGLYWQVLIDGYLIFVCASIDFWLKFNRACLCKDLSLSSNGNQSNSITTNMDHVILWYTSMVLHSERFSLAVVSAVIRPSFFPMLSRYSIVTNF